jgi:16S rRNA C967 or C1407 C5-methylase (RsmB/RsmF family)
MKWKFDEEMLQRLIGQQRVIFEKGLSFLKPGGKIVYATCSILKEENQSQVEHFQRVYSLEQENESFHSVPAIGGMDGFFGVVLKRN